MYIFIMLFITHNQNQAVLAFETVSYLLTKGAFTLDYQVRKQGSYRHYNAFSGTFKDLQRSNFSVFQDLKILFPGLSMR